MDLGRVYVMLRVQRKAGSDGRSSPFAHIFIRDLRLEVRARQVYVPALNDKQFKEKSNSPQTS